MTYQTYQTPPAYVAPVWVDNKVENPDVVKWGGREPPPPIGSEIKILFNRLGVATVTGYFVEDNWLGLLCTLHDAPAWHRKQRKNDPTAHIFGPEYRMAHNDQI